MAKKKQKRKLDFSKLRGIGYLVASVVLACLLVSDYFSTIRTQRAHLNEVTVQRDALAKEKEALQKELELLNNEDYVTRYARENYVFTKEGEMVVILPQQEE